MLFFKLNMIDHFYFKCYYDTFIFIVILHNKENDFCIIPITYTRTLGYIEKDVANDYDSFLKMADNYKLDAENFSDVLGDISEKIGELQESTTAISISVDVKVVGETEENSNELRDIKDSFTI